MCWLHQDQMTPQLVLFCEDGPLGGCRGLDTDIFFVAAGVEAGQLTNELVNE